MSNVSQDVSGVSQKDASVSPVLGKIDEEEKSADLRVQEAIKAKEELLLKARAAGQSLVEQAKADASKLKAEKVAQEKARVEREVARMLEKSRLQAQEILEKDSKMKDVSQALSLEFQKSLSKKK